MNNRHILILLAILGIVIIAVVTLDFISSRPDKLSGNPFKYDMGDIHKVDTALILYHETLQMKLQMEDLTGISYLGNKLYITGKDNLICFDLKGNILLDKVLPSLALCVKATPERVYVGCARQILTVNEQDAGVSVFAVLNDSSLITSIDVSGDKIFAADAGKRVVYRLNRNGEKELVIEGKSESDALHGFILPSPNFDLAFNGFGELWIANPGKHVLENYTMEGRLREWWGKASSNLEGFSGCCNPANFAFLPNGNFITSEKGVVRIKEYKPSGALVGVVAPPSLFGDEIYSPDLTTDETGKIYVLDKEKKMVRIFERNEHVEQNTHSDD